MEEENYHGGRVMHRLREMGTREVKVAPPKPVKVGKQLSSAAFPARYRVVADAALPIFEEESNNWAVQCCLEADRESVGSLQPGKQFMVLDVRRGDSYGFCFGRVESKTRRPWWVVLGLETKDGSLHYSSAERV